MALRLADPSLRLLPGYASVHATLAAAIAAAGASDTIHVRGDAGVFAETNLFVPHASLSLVAYPADPAPVVDGGGAWSHILRLHGGGQTVRGLTLRNAGVAHACVSQNAATQTVEQCTLGPSAGRAVYSVSATPTLRRCRVVDCLTRAVDYKGATAGGTVENCVITGNFAVGVSLGAGMTGRHLAIQGGALSARGVEMLTASTLTNSVVLDCTAAGPGNAGVYLGHASAVVRYTSANGNQANFLVVLGTQHASCDVLRPTFAAGTLRPAAGDVAAIDTGENAGVIVDYDGAVRPQGGGYDRGAYEYTPTTDPRSTPPLRYDGADVRDPHAWIARAVDDRADLPPLAHHVWALLCTDRRARPGDTIPDGTSDPRGWWGAPEGLGSRLWLLDRGTVQPQTAAAARDYIAEALAELVRSGYAGRVAVETAAVDGRLTATITVWRGDTPETLRYADLWPALGGVTL